MQIRGMPDRRRQSRLLVYAVTLLVAASTAALTPAEAQTHSMRQQAASVLAPDVPNLVPPAAGYAQTGADLTSAIVRRFWNRAGGQIFSAPERSAETVPSDGAFANGYTFWPSLLGLHGLIEGERQRPGSYAYWIWQVYSGLEKYWNRDWHCYMAWMMFPGNDDSYYDDNAWAVITLIEAFEATRTSDPQHARVYLDRADEIMNGYEVWGWDSGTVGGVRWELPVPSRVRRTELSPPRPALRWPPSCCTVTGGYLALAARGRNGVAVRWTGS